MTLIEIVKMLLDALENRRDIIDGLNDELDQQRIRAELAEQELDAYRTAERKAS